MAGLRGRSYVRWMALPIALLCATTVLGPASPASGVDETFDTPTDPAPHISNLTLAASPGTGLPGTTALPSSSIDVGTLPLFPKTGAVAAPLNSSPLNSSPLNSSPLNSSPLNSSPLNSSPLNSSPLNSSPLNSSPLNSSYLPPMPLSSVPLLGEGGWATVLKGTRYEGVALGSVTLQQVFALDPQPPALAALALDDVDLSATPLGRASVQAFLLSGATLATLEPDYSICASFSGFTCADHGLSDATSSLLDLELAGAPMSQVSYLQFERVGTADLTRAVIDEYDLLAVDMEATSLGTIPVASLPAVVQCDHGFACGEDSTLADAVEAELTGVDAVVTGATLGDVLAKTELFTVADLTYGALVRSVVDPTKLDYADMDLRELLDGLPIGTQTPRLVAYTADADVDCGVSDPISIGFRLPKGFRYAPGSATLSIDNGAPVAVGDPNPPVVTSDSVMVSQRAVIVDDNVVQWHFGDDYSCPVPTGDQVGPDTEHLRFTFSALPGTTLGTHTTAVALTAADETETLLDAGPFSVGEDLEPNDTPAQATPVAAGTLYLSHISHAHDVDYYALPTGLREGTRISAKLSHLPADFDLFMAGPTGAPLNSSPLNSSPLNSSPLNSSPIEDTGTGDLDGDSLSPEALQDVPVSDALSVSDKRSTETELVSVIVRDANATTPHVLAVTHHLGSTSAQAYMLQVFVDPPPTLTCAAGFSLNSGARGTLPSLSGLDPATKTLFVVNKQRMAAAFGATAADSVLTSLNGLSARPEVKGLVVPVDGDATVVQKYATWDQNRCSPEAGNEVTRGITTVLHQYKTRLPNLQYVVAVGDDDIVPFTRAFDGTTLSNQRDYYENVKFAGIDNPISAASAYGMVLTDNAYTEKQTVDFLDRQLLTPDYVGARLVETPAEITALIDSYAQKPYVDVANTLTTGYDFITDGATAVNAALTARGTKSTLIDETWTAAQLASALTGKTVASVNAHFDHSNLLPAQGNSSHATNPDLFSTATLLTAGLPTGALLFTIGCEAGLNVPGRSWASATGAEAARLQDWAQSLAQLKALGFFANTGYGYGDDTVVAYSERFIELFGKNLDGTMTIGQAVMKARDSYAREAALDVYHEKVLNEATFYGLPFARVGAAGTEAPVASDTPTGPALPVDSKYGVQSAAFSVSPTLSPKTTPEGTYYTVPGTQTATALYRPVMPALPLALPPTPAGTAQGDVLVTGLTSGAATALATPSFVLPTSDRTAFDPPSTPTDVAFPVSLWSNGPEGGVTLYPAQFRSTGATGGTQETLAGVTGKVFYPTGNPSTWTRPTINAATAVDLGGATTFQVEATGAKTVLVLYRTASSPTWSPLELTAVAAATGGATYVGTVTGATIEYFVQAVRDGLVGSARGKGLNLHPEPAPTQSGLTLAVEGVQQNGWFRRTPVLKASGRPGVVFEASVNGGPFQAVGAAGLPVATTGLVVLQVRGSDGSTGRAYALVDTAAPTVTITSPTAGGRVSRPTEAAFTCADSGSGLASCTALDSTTLSTAAGLHTFRVKAVDKAGNETVGSVDYQGGYLFEGFFQPVDNPAVWNVVQAGATVPMKFRVKHGDGVQVTDTAVVKPPASRDIPCAGGASSPLSSLDANTTSGLRYDTVDQQFVFTWKLAKTWAGTCREFTLTLDDGSVHTALFQIKK